MANLTKTQHDFVDYYINTLNPKEAAILAGYPTEEAEEYGRSLINNKRIISEVKKQLKQNAQNLYVTRSYIVSKLLDIIEFSVEEEEILTKDGSPTGKSKLRDTTCALRALMSLSKLVEGCENMSQPFETTLEVDNLNIEKI